MKKNVISKILAGTLAATMVLGMAACGDTTDPGTSGSGSGSGNESGGSQAGDNSGSGADQGGDNSGNTGESNQGEEKLPPMKLTISCVSYNTEHEESDPIYDKLVADLNEYLNADITWEWQTQTNGYFGRLGLRYAAGDVADVMIVGFDPAFYSAATGGEFETLAYDENGDPVMKEVLDEEGNPKKDEDGNVIKEQDTVTASVTEPIFWDLAKYIDEKDENGNYVYDNLATIAASTRADVSYKGGLYAIPRSRPAGRNGFGYRQDWLNKLNLKEPETWEDFEKMLWEFTYGDPDGNTIDDTVGLAYDGWNGMWDIMMAWFGVPNTWGVDENGDLIHRSRTPEYMTAMKAFRKLFDDGVVNDGSQTGVPKWDTLSAGDAQKKLLRTGMAGVLVQVLDDCRKVETYFQDEGLNGAVKGTMDEDELVFMLQSYVLTDSGNNEPHIQLFSGSGNGIAISKTGNVKTEDDLRRVLQILNDMNDGDCINLIDNGWEGVTYELDDDGYISLWMGNSENDEDGTKAKLDAAGVTTLNYRDGFNQVLAYYTAEANAASVTKPPSGTAITLLEEELKNGEGNKPYLVPSMGAGYTSEYYVLNGTALNTMLSDAESQFMRGEIDETAFQAALDQWWTAGGEQVTKEMNDAYHAAGN